MLLKSSARFAVIASLVLCVSSVCATESVTYYYTDAQGTPLLDTDASGVSTSANDFRPYGTPAIGLLPSGPGYAGHVFDPDAELSYMQARYYDPSVGRFLSVDPKTAMAGVPDTFSSYAYVSDNPINRTDPTGTYACDTAKDKDQCEAISKARARAANAARSYSRRSPQGKALNKILDFYGTENDGNGVVVQFGALKDANAITHFEPNAGVVVTFDLNQMASSYANAGMSQFGAAVEAAATFIHEGQHIVDAIALNRDPSSFDERLSTETAAFLSQSYVNRAFRVNSPYEVWMNSWPSQLSDGMSHWQADLWGQCATSRSLCNATH